MRLVGRIAAIVVFSVVASPLVSGLPAAAADPPSVVVWADPAVASVLREVLAPARTGVDVEVVVKPTALLAAGLANVATADAPDLVWLPNSMIGELAAGGLIDRLALGPALRDRFPARLLDGFRYGFAYYGLPIRYSNVALIVNTDLVPTPPATFAALERRAVRLVADGRADLGLAIGQGADPDTAALYPLMSGLGGYLFGRNSAGSLDAYNVGVACPAFLANAAQIDGWNDSGLLSSTTTQARARKAFLAGRAPFWIADPEAVAGLESVDFGYSVRAVPPMVDGLSPSPLLDVEGIALTTFAEDRGTADGALTIVRKVLARPDVQATLAAAAGLAPANPDAAMSAQARNFADAGAAGVAMPNIEQADALWPAIGSAWAASTSGSTAVGARTAFTLALRAAVAAVG